MADVLTVVAKIRAAKGKGDALAALQGQGVSHNHGEKREARSVTAPRHYLP
jgi:hypothetical protein